MYSGFRYTVFGSFVVCNTLVVTSAIWNLSLLQSAGSFFSAAATSDKYSTFQGCAGLVFVFPLLFCEIARKDIFVTKVWFELAWVAAFCILGLVGAALSTVAGIDSLCPHSRAADITDGQQCISSRVLQGASWMSSLLLLCYFALLGVFSLLKNREDKTIWQCYARKFPWDFSQTELPSTPLSPTVGHQRKTSKISLRRFITRSSKAPTIAAPRPRRAANDQAIQEGILSYRSGLSLEYEIEHFRPGIHPIARPEVAFMIEERYQPLAQAATVPTATPLSYSLYPEHMRAAMANVVDTPPAQSSFPPGPSPIGNWPQLNPPLRRPGHRLTAATTDATTGYHLPSPTSRSRPAGPRRPSISYARTSLPLTQLNEPQEQPVDTRILL